MKKILAGLLLLAPIGAFAQAYQLNLQGARQIGKGSTGIAQPTDATALFTNPGSAAFLSGNDVTMGISPVISKGSFTDVNTDVISNTDNPVVTPFNLSAVYGTKSGKLKFGLSVYTPFGSSMRWKPGSAGRFDIKEISLLSISFQPTVSYRITKKLGIGIGFIYTYGHVAIKKDLPVQFLDGTFGDASINANANGFGFNAGLYYAASDKLALGLTYRSGLNMKTNAGTVTFNVPASLQSNFLNQGIDAELPLPQIFGLGLTYKPSQHWAVNAEGYLSDWSNYDTIRVNYEQQPVAGASYSDMIRDYKTGYSVRLGAAYLSGKSYELRAGLIYSISPIQDGFLSPDVPDANRLNPSIGASYNITQRFRLDAALLAEFIYRKDHNLISGIDGTYNFHLIIPSVGLTYKF